MDPDAEMSGTRDSSAAGPSGHTRAGSGAQTPPDGPQRFEGQNILLKQFDPWSQHLAAVGAFYVDREKPLHETMVNLLGWDKSVAFIVFEEMDGYEDIYAREVADLTSSSKQTFQTLGYRDLCILIVQKSLSDEERDTLLTEGKFAEPQDYIRHYYLCRNFPHLGAGHVVLDYFLSESYTGEILQGLPHGHGTKTYHDTVYTGDFRLGLRHGQGKRTNGVGDTYTGGYYRDRRHGRGEELCATWGNKYVGSWENGRKSGSGVMYFQKPMEFENTCRICWEAQANTAFYDCGHVLSCTECAPQVQTCPICRKTVLARLKLYNYNDGD